MSAPTREPFPTHDADLALAVLLEPLARGARVLWIGDAGSGAERLAASASSIEAVSNGGPRRTRGSKAGTIRSRGWPTQGEAFDLVIADGEADPTRLTELARLVEVGGALVVSIEARSTDVYAQLHEALARSFASVRMLGQTRFTGFAHVDFARADGSELAFDGSALTAAERPLRWIGVAGSVDRDLESYLVVQTPTESAAERPAERAQPGAALERELEAARARLEHAEKRLEQAQREIARSGQKLDELRHQLDESQSVVTRKDAELKARPVESKPPTESKQVSESKQVGESKPVAESKLVADSKQTELRALEASYAELEERLHGQAKELTSLRNELERRALLVRDLVEELRAARERAKAARSSVVSEGLPEVDRLRAQLVGVQRRLGDAEGERAAAVFRADELGAQIERLRRSSPASAVPAAAVPAAAVPAAAVPAAAVPAAAVPAAAVPAAAVPAAAVPAAHPAPSLQEVAERESLRSELRALTERHAAEKESLFVAGAEAEGRVRGLGARVAELEELRSLAEARLALTQDDLRRTRERMRAIESDGEQSREQLAMARMRPPDVSAEERDARREGELRGALHLAREALVAVQDERDGLLRELTRARTGLVLAEQEAHAARDGAAQLLAQERSELESLRGAEASARAALVELRGAHEARLAALDSLEGERSGLRLRLADAEAALASAQERIARGEGDRASQRAAHDALKAERDALQTSAETARILSDKIRSHDGDATLAEGDALDLEQQVALLDAERAEARKIGILLGDVERDLEMLRKERDAETARAREAESALSQAQEGERIKVTGWVQRIQAREALVGRLQTALASAESSRKAHQAELASMQMRLMRAEEASTALEVARDVQRSEEQRDRTALADAALSARAAADALGHSRERGLSTLAEAREALAALLGGIKAPAPNAPEAVLRDEVAALRRELEDRGLMLRSLTAQLEERDERVRSFEMGGASQAMQGLEARLREAEEKETRLVRELELAAERRTAAMEREAELRRLEQLIGDRDGQLMESEGHLEQSTRAHVVLRDQLARVSSELESVLGKAQSDSAGVTIERLGEILRGLRKS